MDSTFNLLDEPWLPVRLADGRVVELGLLEVLERSSEIVALAETAPPNLVAQYRLLLAITHRALSRAFGNWKDGDRARWYRYGLPVAEIRAYLEQWRERFHLFHPVCPFMQVVALATAEETRDKCKPWTQIALASANGNAPVVFDHAYDSAPAAIAPAYAVSTLLGFLQFTPGGLVKTLRDADKAGALVNTAAVIPVGATLSRTLCLCLHPASTGRSDEDLPAWEREPLTVAQLRGDPVLATGPNDRYTRQSRAVLLLREVDGSIRWIRFAAGLALGEDSNAPDPMASFRAGSNGLVRLTFSEGRALWRDLSALVPNPAGESQPAAVLNYAIGLHQLDSFDRVYQPILVAGLASDQAKLLRWRLEQIVLPASLLADAEKSQYLRELMGVAETLFSDLRSLSARMVAEILPDPASKDTRSRARSLLDAGPFAASYFAEAERALPQMMRLVGEGKSDQAELLWRNTLRAAAQLAWNQVLAGLGSSVRALQADAKFWPRFHGLLNKLVPRPEFDLAKEA
jgi:CRISPR system Cascade subunit CasA